MEHRLQRVNSDNGYHFSGSATLEKLHVNLSDPNYDSRALDTSSFENKLRKLFPCCVEKQFYIVPSWQNFNIIAQDLGRNLNA